MSEPVIFLDVDGVLNHRGVFVPGNGTDPLCPKAVRRFRALVDRTGAAVVLSSTWRLGGKDSRHFQKLQSAGVLDRLHKDWRTVDLPGRFESGLYVPDDPRRGREIEVWLAEHPYMSNYVIIDDDSDMLPEQMPRFVQTSFDTGLLPQHCERATAIIQQGMKDTGETK